MRDIKPNHHSFQDEDGSKNTNHIVILRFAAGSLTISQLKIISVLNSANSLNPSVPTVSSCSQTQIGSSGGESVLVTASDNGNANQCAVSVSPRTYYTALSGAEWIWEESPNNTAGPTSATFQKQFVLNAASDVESASISFAADNFYQLKVNGVTVANDPQASANDPANEIAHPGDDGNNFQNIQTTDISGQLTSGTNTVAYTVANKDSSAAPNPGTGVAGLFRIDLDTRVSSCSNYPVNHAPTARLNATYQPAGSSAAYQAYELDASGSSDPDGDNLSYQWAVTNAESSDPGQPVYTTNASIASPNSAITDSTFQNARSDTYISYTLELTVTDTAGNTDTAPTTVSVSCDPDTGACASQSGGGAGGPGGIGFQ